MEHLNGITSAPQAPITPLVMNDVQAAAYLGISPHTLRKMRTTGRGPSYRKIGKNVRYMMEDLTAYIEKQKVSR
jgi:excisionase family DNA binding protein